METITLSENGIWFEEHNFVFDCIVTFLQSSIAFEDNPLTLLSMAALFHNLDDTNHKQATLIKIENILENLTEIEDSGLQQRDCLFVSGYNCFVKEICNSTHAFDKITAPRIEYAVSQQWFNDPRLAVIVALSVKDETIRDAARSFLKDNTKKWIERDYILGVLCYCLIETDISGDLITYLSKYNWQKDDLEKLAWGLLVLGRLVRQGYALNHIQILIGNRINNILRLNKPVSMSVEQTDENRNPSQLTSFETAFAAYALNQEGFDRIVGVQAHSKRNLTALLAIQEELAKGGVIISKRLYMVFMGTIFLFLGIIVWQLTNLAGLDQLWAALLGIVLAVLLAWFGRFIFQKENPLAKTIPLGDVIKARDIMGKENGKN